MYVCGPTVYDSPHIGNARTAVVFDTIRRYLEWAGFEVTYVSNVTDVEDKIIARAAREGRTEPDVAREYETVYFDQMARLGVREADYRPHATEYIDRMLGLIGELVDRGHAYEVPGQGVYFDVESFEGYGALPHRTLDGAPGVGRRAGRRRRGEAQPHGLRALEGGQARRAGVGLAVGPRPAGLAHRVLGDVARPARRGLRPPRRWRRPHVPAPRERAGAGREPPATTSPGTGSTRAW